MKKKRQPQFELPGAEEAFNLAGEIEQDPWKKAAEIARQKMFDEEAARVTKEQQPEML